MASAGDKSQKRGDKSRQPPNYGSSPVYDLKLVYKSIAIVRRAVRKDESRNMNA
jgi:hypothetical protein